MLFNSLTYSLFLPLIFLIYWLISGRSLKAQNLMLLAASYFFYGWWDWRFLIMLISLSMANYLIGSMIGKNEEHRRRWWLILGLCVNLGVLGFFKYFDFFVQSFIDMFALVGYSLPVKSTSIILPLGISFYVFLSISYILDIYKKTSSANHNLIDVLLSLSFFPIILAGPIHRPSSLLQQISKKREFRYEQVTDGLRQILWGLLVKVVIADKLALHVNNIFQNYSGYSGSTLFLGAVLFAIQIYADFSGYSNIAIGSSKLLGFSLIRNFAYPYFARDITEFWKRWHISLTTWFRDYLFLPLSFSVSWRVKGEKVLLIKRDLFIYIVASVITWLFTGLWHGANYTFIAWGLINGFLLIVYQWQKKPRKKLLKRLGTTNENSYIVFIETLFTFAFVVFAWIFFRADSIDHAVKFISKIFSTSLFSAPQVFPVKMVVLSSVFILIEWVQREKEFGLQIENIKYRPLRWSIYYLILVLILLMSENQQSFIYAQF